MTGAKWTGKAEALSSLLIEFLLINSLSKLLAFAFQRFRVWDNLQILTSLDANLMQMAADKNRAQFEHFGGKN
jgi:hypothetical protein